MVTCDYCDKPLGLVRRLRGERFCSVEHADQYARQQAEFALERLTASVKNAETKAPPLCPPPSPEPDSMAQPLSAPAPQASGQDLESVPRREVPAPDPAKNLAAPPPLETGLRRGIDKSAWQPSAPSVPTPPALDPLPSSSLASGKDQQDQSDELLFQSTIEPSNPDLDHQESEESEEQVDNSELMARFQEFPAERPPLIRQPQPEPKIASEPPAPDYPMAPFLMEGPPAPAAGAPISASIEAERMADGWGKVAQRWSMPTFRPTPEDPRTWNEEKLVSEVPPLVEPRALLTPTNSEVVPTQHTVDPEVQQFAADPEMPSAFTMEPEQIAGPASLVETGFWSPSRGNTGALPGKLTCNFTARSPRMDSLWQAQGEKLRPPTALDLPYSGPIPRRLAPASPAEVADIPEQARLETAIETPRALQLAPALRVANHGVGLAGGTVTRDLLPHIAQQDPAPLSPLLVLSGDPFAHTDFRLPVTMLAGRPRPAPLDGGMAPHQPVADPQVVPAARLASEQPLPLESAVALPRGAGIRLQSTWSSGVFSSKSQTEISDNFAAAGVRNRVSAWTPRTTASSAPIAETVGAYFVLPPISRGRLDGILAPAHVVAGLSAPAALTAQDGLATPRLALEFAVHTPFVASTQGFSWKSSVWLPMQPYALLAKARDTFAQPPLALAKPACTPGPVSQPGWVCQTRVLLQGRPGTRFEIAAHSNEAATVPARAQIEPPVRHNAATLTVMPKSAFVLCSARLEAVQQATARTPVDSSMAANLRPAGYRAFGPFPKLPSRLPHHYVDLQAPEFHDPVLRTSPCWKPAQNHRNEPLTFPPPQESRLHPASFWKWPSLAPLAPARPLGDSFPGVPIPRPETHAPVPRIGSGRATAIQAEARSADGLPKAGA